MCSASALPKSGVVNRVFAIMPRHFANSKKNKRANKDMHANAATCANQVCTKFTQHSFTCLHIELANLPHHFFCNIAKTKCARVAICEKQHTCKLSIILKKVVAGYFSQARHFGVSLCLTSFNFTQLQHIKPRSRIPQPPVYIMLLVLACRF